MECPKCQTENPRDKKFCQECGAELLLVCPNCGTALGPEDKFCGDCGHDLHKPKGTKPLDYDRPDSYTPKHLADKILATRSAIEGERKIVTILFADAANSTAMFEKLDPEAVHEIMDRFFRLLMDEIHRYEGTINQFRGDGVMALFGAPIAHADHAQRACHAAFSLQKSLELFGERLKRDYGADFKMRIGLNSGPVVVGSIGDDLRMDYTAEGDTVNLAARMESSAQPGSVLVSKHTYNQAKEFFEFEPLGEIQVKGKEESVEAYRLIKPTEVQTRIAASAAKDHPIRVGQGTLVHLNTWSITQVQANMNKRIIDKEIVKDVASRMSDSEIAQKYNLSGTELQSAFKQLGKLRRKRIQALAGDLKSGMAHSDIMTKYQLSAEGLESALKRLLRFNAISAAEFETFSTFRIEEGMNDSALMEKYQLSKKGLQNFFKKPMDAGFLKQKQGEPEKRHSEPQEAAEYVRECSQCGKPHESFVQSPEYGSIGSRVSIPPPLEQTEESNGSERQDRPRRGYGNALQKAVGRIYDASSLPLEKAKRTLTRLYVVAIAGATIMALIMLVFFGVQRRADESSQSKAENSKPTNRETIRISEVDRPEKNSQGALDEELLHRAEMGNTKLILPLLQEGADINARSGKYKRTPLMLAAFRGHVDTVKLLLEKGADGHAKTEYGGTALMLASGEGHIEVVRLLLEKGADLNEKTKDGGTALMLAAFGGHVDTVKLLLEKGADVNANDEGVGTALMLASGEGHLEVVRLLLEKGADVSVRTIGGTARELASKKGHIQIVDLLKAKGAKE